MYPPRIIASGATVAKSGLSFRDKLNDKQCPACIDGARPRNDTIAVALPAVCSH